MKKMNRSYIGMLLSGVLLMSAGSLFCAESLEAEQKRQKAIEAMHSATTVDQLKEALAQGACLENCLVEKTEGQQTNMFLLGSIMRNSSAKENLIDFLIEMNSPKRIMFKFKKGKAGVITASVPPLFSYDQSFLDQKKWNEAETSNFLEKYKRLIQKGIALDDRFKIVRQSDKCLEDVKDETFADYALDFFNNRVSRVTPLQIVKFTFALCNVIHVEGEKRYNGLPDALTDGLPKLSLDLCGIVKGYVAAGDRDELDKIRKLLANPLVQKSLQDAEYWQKQLSNSGQ